MGATGIPPRGLATILGQRRGLVLLPGLTDAQGQQSQGSGIVQAGWQALGLVPFSFPGQPIPKVHPGELRSVGHWCKETQKNP